MDQETLRRVQHVLQSLVLTQVVKVSFLLNNNGRLVAHFGHSPAFHPQARFPEFAEGEEGENVYLTGLEDRFILGVVFAEATAMEAVRDALENVRPQLHHILSHYMT